MDIHFSFIIIGCNTYKASWEAVLASTLQVLVSSLNVARLAILDALRSHVASCPLPAPGNAHFCLCCWNIRSNINDADSSSWTNLASTLVRMLTRSSTCPACVGAVKHIMAWFQTHVDSAIHRTDQRLALEFNMEKGDRVRIGEKRCAVDEDFKLQVAQKKIRSGEYFSATDSLRSDDAMASKSTGRKWEESVLRTQVAANILSFTSPRTVSTSCDGKRLGCPDEETIAYYVWEASANRACILPPQVQPVCIMDKVLLRFCIPSLLIRVEMHIIETIFGRS